MQNGVRIILEEMPILRSVAIEPVKTGSRNESRNNGISILLNICFQRTKSRFTKLRKALIVSVGKNALHLRNTHVFAKVLDTHASYALVLSDMFFNSVFDEKNWKRKVVLKK